MLVEENATLLEQAAQLLESLSEESYVKPEMLLDGQRIGRHIRHIIDFYEQFLNGLSRGSVNYDARQRDLQIEVRRDAAISRLQYLASALRSDVRLVSDRPIRVASEGAVHSSSSTGRELQAICSHTVHHFALIAVLLKLQGRNAPSNFGVSRSTVRYRGAYASEAA